METISLKQLKENVKAFYQAGIFECDKQFEQSPLFKVPANAFEIVSEKAGSPINFLCHARDNTLRSFVDKARIFHLVFPLYTEEIIR